MMNALLKELRLVVDPFQHAAPEFRMM
jgi:hypothetical protein